MTLDPDRSAASATAVDESDGLARRRGREIGADPAGEQPIVEVAPGARNYAPRRAKARSARRNFIEWVAVIGGAIIVAVVVRTFLFQTFWIPSPSMSPTLVKNDRVLVNKLSYKVHDIHRGDVLVFKRPPNEPVSTIKDLIKRVVGLPGERVSIMDGEVSIDGRKLTEPYTHGLETTYQAQCGPGDVTGIDKPEGLTIPKGKIFVMGDNRVNSSDGRCFGPIDEGLVVGRAFVIIWPPSKMGGL